MIHLEMLREDIYQLDYQAHTLPSVKYRLRIGAVVAAVAVRLVVVFAEVV